MEIVATSQRLGQMNEFRGTEVTARCNERAVACKQGIFPF